MTEGSITRKDYLERVERAKRWAGLRLGFPISLEDMAAEAAFSKYHFHRVFSALAGESPAAYVQRLRLDKAANLLENHLALSVSEIALECGFATPSSFARDFKARFRMTPRVFRARPRNVGARAQGSAPDAAGAALHAADVGEAETPRKDFPWRFDHSEPLRLAEARGEGRYDRAAAMAWGRLMGSWFRSGRKEAPSPAYGIAWDNPGITREESLRYSACAPLKAGEALPRGLYELGLPGCACLVLSFEGSRSGYAEAYTYLYGIALPDSGFLPADSPGFELYHSLSKGDRASVELWLPLS
jgi:AraC family transcriptional regulator